SDVCSFDLRTISGSRIIIALTGKDTKYFVARTKESNDEDSLVRTNTFNGMQSSVTEFGQADAYDDFETAKGTAQWMNAAPPLIKRDYDYYVIQDRKSVV